MVLYVLQTILKPIGGNIMNALNTIKDLIVQLTGLLVAAVGLGVVSAIVLQVTGSLVAF